MLVSSGFGGYTAHAISKRYSSLLVSRQVLLALYCMLTKEQALLSGGS